MKQSILIGVSQQLLGSNVTLDQTILVTLVVVVLSGWVEPSYER